MAEKIVVEENKDEAPQPVTAITRRSRTWVIGVVVGVVALYVVIVIGGLWFLHALSGARPDSMTGMNGRTTMSHRMGGGYGSMYGQQTFTQTQSSSDGLTNTATTTTYTQTQGVVTAVSGDSITVAGGGKTQMIKTNGSTSYDGDTKPAVNDTVIIVGTKDGDTITATEVSVRN